MEEIPMTVLSKPPKFCEYFHQPFWDKSYGLVVCMACGSCFRDDWKDREDKKYGK